MGGIHHNKEVELAGFPVWNRSQQGHVTTTLTFNCNSDGSVEMETPPSHGGYSATFESPGEAATEIVKMFSAGIQQAK